MAFLNSFKDLLFSDMINNFDVRMLIMWAIGGILIYLAIKKEMEPTLLLPMGFGAILVNLPISGAITQYFQFVDGVKTSISEATYNKLKILSDCT